MDNYLITTSVDGTRKQNNVESYLFPSGLEFLPSFVSYLHLHSVRNCLCVNLRSYLICL